MRFREWERCHSLLGKREAKLTDLRKKLSVWIIILGTKRPLEHKLVKVNNLHFVTTRLYHFPGDL